MPSPTDATVARATDSGFRLLLRVTVASGARPSHGLVTDWYSGAFYVSDRSRRREPRSPEAPAADGARHLTSSRRRKVRVRRLDEWEAAGE